MASTDNASPTIGDGVVMRPRRRNTGTYGHWLQPIINTNDQASTATAEPQPLPAPTPSGRGRGRPRVNKVVRDASAIEKRRAQVREAQRTYQKRKDSATTTDKRRADELLQVLADLSSDVETLLQAASKAGMMQGEHSVSKSIQRLWATYNTAINSPAIQPELRLQQLKNDRRLADDSSVQDGTIAVGCRHSPVNATTSIGRPMYGKSPTPLLDLSTISFEQADFEETTVALSFQRVVLAGKSIYQEVQERQAALKEAERSFSR